VARRFPALGWLLLTLAGAVLYEVLRPGIWPWVFLIALVAGGLALAYQRAPVVRVERLLSQERAFSGESLTVSLTVTVRSPLPVLVSFEEVTPLTVIPDRPAALTGLVWGTERRDFTYAVTPNSRGIYRWPPGRLGWSDPLGLFQHSRRETGGTAATELLVYPGSHQALLPELARPLLSEGPTSRTRALEDPASIAGARDYLPGDPPRRIHWRQTARHGLDEGGHLRRLVVRELEWVAATGVLVHLDLDVSGRSGGMYLESAARLAASIVREAHGLGLPVGVATSGAVTPLGAGFPALEAALTLLATVEPRPGSGHELSLPPPGSNLVVITQGAPTELIEGALRARARAARVLVVVLPEGFYLEPGETPRPLFVAPPETVRDLLRRASLLEEAGVRVVVLRGDQSVLRLAMR
jgi:uncharacterized protein (DUF58 family)